jgi:molybdopterin converting factor small subunit
VTVTVKLFASFRAGRFAVKTVDHPDGTTVADVVDGLSLPRAEVGIIMINSRHADFDRRLAEGDTLALFPLLGGG